MALPAAEMQKALRLELAQGQVPAAFKDLRRGLLSRIRNSGQMLTIANGLCLTAGDVSQDFKALLKNDYDAELFGGALEIINGWGKQKTAGKIDKILEKLDANSVCVLLNAVYFSGKKGDLWISQIKHKAVVEINEEGTEAAAATAVEMATKSAPRRPVFRAGHPFVFLIQDNQTGSILFMGKVTHPARPAA